MQELHNGMFRPENRHLSIAILILSKCHGVVRFLSFILSRSLEICMHSTWQNLRISIHRHRRNNNKTSEVPLRHSTIQAGQHQVTLPTTWFKHVVSCGYQNNNRHILRTIHRKIWDSFVSYRNSLPTVFITGAFVLMSMDSFNCKEWYKVSWVDHFSRSLSDDGPRPIVWTFPSPDPRNLESIGCWCIKIGFDSPPTIPPGP
jgi:hypothetical protein